MDDKTLSEEAVRRCCRDWLKGGVGAAGLRAEKISGGITNVLYRVHKADGGALCDEVAGDVGVGVRFYGPSGVCEVVDRAEEALVAETAAELCKRTFFKFEGGQIDEWLVGRHIEISECLMPNFRDAIASHLARFHSVAYPTAPRREEHALLARLRYWLPRLCANSDFGKLPPAAESLAIQFYQDFTVFVRAYALIESSPVAQEVLCHNDLLTGNIILSGKVSPRGTPVAETELSVEFIDYEYASKGWNVYDIANHLVETGGANWDRPHSNDYVRAFVNTYLDSLSGCCKDASCGLTVATTASTPRDEDTTDNSSSDPPCELLRPSRAEELDEFCRLVQLCGPLSHFYWGVWALAQLLNTLSLQQPNACDFLKFSQLRFDHWRAHKPRIISAVAAPH